MTVKRYPQSQWKFRLHDNVEKLSMEEIKVETKCDALVNLGYFSMQSATYFDHSSAICFGGAWGLEPQWHEWGICIDKDGEMTRGTEQDMVYDYAIALPPVYIGGGLYRDDQRVADGATYTGLTADGTVVILVGTEDNPVSSAQATEALLAEGCVDVFRWDGGWSSQGMWEDGTADIPSQRRKCRSWLLVYQKDEVTESEDEVVQWAMEKGLTVDGTNGGDSATMLELWQALKRVTET